MTNLPDWSGFQRLGTRTLAEAQWLRLDQIAYRDGKGRERTWEAAERAGNQQAVMVLARLVPSNRIVLVEQYRPPVDAPVVEFPAGLVDPGEEPTEAALRELREETGYSGRVLSGTPPCLNTPGMTSEAASVVVVEVDETRPENATPVPQPDDGEHIHVHCVPETELPAFIQACHARAVRMDIKVVCYAQATA